MVKTPCRRGSTASGYKMSERSVNQEPGIAAIKHREPDGMQKLPGTAKDDQQSAPGRRPVYRIFGKEFKKPGSPAARYALAIALMVGGVFGFLPILGFWMLPLGLLILSHELHVLRRLRRRWAVWQGRRKAMRDERKPEPVAKR